MRALNRPLAQFVLACCLAAAPFLPASAQTAAPKRVIRGEAIDTPAAPGPATNAAPPAQAPAAPAKVIPVSTTVVATPASAPGNSEAVQSVEFTKLSGYQFLVPDLPDTNQVAGSDIANKQIPADIKALNGKRISVIGYLMPLREKEGKSTEFLLMRTQATCCFGIAPTITDLITVKAAGKGVPTIMDDLIEIQGTLRVGTVREDGYIVGVYQMDEGKFMGRSDR
jgi:hypothetical protein